MSSPAVGYWVADNLGRVLGPLALQALRELIASGRLKAAVRASRDGAQWVAVQDLPELRDLFVAARPGPSAEHQQAERLRTQLKGLQNLPPHEVFGAKPTSSLDEVRLAFFRMAKRFSPEHLAPETHPELRKVSAEIFDFLSRCMREVEVLYAQGAFPQSRPLPPRLDMNGPLPPPPPAVASVAPPVPSVAPAVARPPAPAPAMQQVAAQPVMQVAARAPVAEPPVMPAMPQRPPPPVMHAAPPAPSAPPVQRTHTLPPPAARPAPPPPAPPLRKAAAAPTYSSAEFVGLERRTDDRIHADVRVSLQNAGIFTDHRIINLSSGGLFIATDKPLRLGTLVELTLRFDEPSRVMTLRSSVIWENSLDDGKNPRGYGLRLSSLRKEEREFIQQFVSRKPPK
ncbi:DnaJ domain-containing protein [Myxococcus stipitatus DSM 14675]|uniref:DnaJ domain-containing protein n=1 Tax=Myxococcus stipitatus (strain DSM 14675 / JCM 12634 / Mx s8) TaxID=1278073 RepID=L7UJ27_MYXSD|nr:TIGR02266 family protein [Myxococcus stipitatus]AGC47910.1 DnaJ domain-containing protein [Myxococcus stipitatus DSM 14675]